MLSRRLHRCACSLALVCALGTPAYAERLPATIYTTADGLPNNNVFRVLPDSRGFIWFATREGLSRFDGYTFTNYDEDDGLPSAIINDVIETRDGVYLVATTRGLARLETTASPRARFTVHRISDDPASQFVVTLYESRSAIWVSTRGGLFRIEKAAGDMQFHRVEIGTGADDPPECLYEDRFGTLWLATATGLRRLWPDGRIDIQSPLHTHSVLEDRTGHIWAGTRFSGLVEVTLDARSGRVERTRIYAQSAGFPYLWVNGLLQGPDGDLWAGAPGGLIRVSRTASDAPQFRMFSEAEGVGRGGFQSLALDRSGNLWAATMSTGAIKIARSGFSTFGPADGFRWGVSLIEAKSGAVCFMGPSKLEWGLYCFNGSSLELIQPRFKPGVGTMSWGWNQLMLQDHLGEWWFATREGVARMGKAMRPQELAGRAPKQWFTTADGLAAPVIFRLFEDSRGDIWIASVEAHPNGLSRWERATNTFQHYSRAPNLPDLSSYLPTALGEDAAGNVWIGFSGPGGVARYRNGAFDPLDTRGLFRASVRNFFRDSKGRLWIASYDRLVRVDNPGAASPTFKVYSTKEGLSSNQVSAIVEDLEGRLYVGTGRGVDRLDPDSGRVRHYSERDGFLPSEIQSGLLDRRTGHLWFAQQAGISRLILPDDPAPVSPPILITSLEIAGRAESINPLGATVLPALRLEPNRNNLRIEYVALGFAPGEDLHYQYRLDGAQGEWSAPSTQRTVNFANLAPGAYRFTVRAISADGVMSLQPASVEFTILPPVWRRAWFLALTAAAALSLIYAAYRYRLRQALEVATVRARIASDLHDDVGANLTKIAVLSEVARQHLDRADGTEDRLSAIARISRESVDSMSDAVWSINPRRDNLRDTIRRMRQHAEEMLTDAGIDLAFRAPEGDRNFRVPIDVRRDFFLIFKEALNNAVRHSNCRRIVVDIRADESSLSLRLTDDGAGFDEEGAAAGNGLTSMRRRASSINAALDIVSVPGAGTTVDVVVPGSFSRRLRWPA